MLASHSGVAAGASLLVTLGDRVSVWYSAVVRGDVHTITIGADSNVQDGAVLHGTLGEWPVLVGERVSIGHSATVHGCVIEDDVLIGIGATIMDGVKIGDNSIVAGHSIVTENAEFPENAIIAGVPAKQVGTRDCGRANLINARFYLRNAQNMAKGIDRFSNQDVAFIMGKADG